MIHINTLSAGNILIGIVVLALKYAALSHTGSFGWNVASSDIVWPEETYQILGADRTVKPTID
jgi:hypothetical protein